MKLAALAMFAVLIGCSSSSTTAPAKTAATNAPGSDHDAPVDQSRWMPLQGRISTEMVPDHMNGRRFLSGGTVGHYKGYDLFLVNCGSAGEAGSNLLEYKQSLKDPKLVPSFGGYFGDDAGKPVFLFTKGTWLAGISGLPQQQADAVARPFAVLIR